MKMHWLLRFWPLTAVASWVGVVLHILSQPYVYVVNNDDWHVQSVQ